MVFLDPLSDAVCWSEIYYGFFYIYHTKLYHIECTSILSLFQQKVILDNIRCDEHQTKMTCLFCRTCDHLVCPDCISSKHNEHNFEPVEKILPKKLDELKGDDHRFYRINTSSLSGVHHI
jgi:hypothetical protein